MKAILVSMIINIFFWFLNILYKDSNLMKHTKKELKLFDWTDDKELYKGLLAKNVIQLMLIFSYQNHSGGSSGSVLHIFDKLARLYPLTPLTGEDNEWRDSAFGDYKQNIRLSSVFKEKGKAYFISKNGEHIPVSFPLDVYKEGLKLW